MKNQLIFATIAVIAAFHPAHSDILRIDDSSLHGKVINAKEAPRRGMSKAAVEKKYGTPLERQPAVGKPPISSWLYSEYRVYFEHDHVIHSVSQ